MIDAEPPLRGSGYRLTWLPYRNALYHDMSYSYTYAPETKAELNWAQLRTLKLSDFDSADEAVRERLEEQFAAAVYEDGFLYLTETGLSQDQVSHL